MAKITPKGPDPAKVASNVYKKLFENKLVRVFVVRFKPGERAEMHWHPNHIAYIFENGSLEVVLPDGDVMRMAARAGDVAWMDSGHHEAINRGDADFHALVIEFKGNVKKLGR